MGLGVGRGLSSCGWKKDGKFLQILRTAVLGGIEDSGLGSARALKISDQETAPLRLAGHLDSDKRAALGRAFNKASGKSSVAQDVKNDVQSAKLARKPVGGGPPRQHTSRSRRMQHMGWGVQGKSSKVLLPSERRRMLGLFFPRHKSLCQQDQVTVSKAEYS